jgi:hypothetical protein
VVRGKDNAVAPHTFTIASLVLFSLERLYVTLKGIIPHFIEFLQPVPITADWKTYINDEFGTSFNYPNGWIVMPPHRYHSRVRPGMIADVAMGPRNKETSSSRPEIIFLKSYSR